MGIEIEAKFRANDPEALREELLAAGARSLGTVLEDNTYFDTPDGALRRSDRGLRIRIAETTAGSGPAPPGRAVLTYKGPRQAGELKIRPEAETALDSPDSARAILEALGYLPTLSFQKRRESFRLGAARIELDELPGLGFFLEIEADDEAEVHAARQALGLENEPTITKTYIELVAGHLVAGKTPEANELNF